VKGVPLVLVAGIALAAPLAAWASAAFRTPGRAAYCGVSEGESPRLLICWTPNDGFTTELGAHGRPYSGYYHFHVGYHEPVRTLRFGLTWRVNGWWRCTSRSSGLTCINRDGHGVWLGRFKGYRIF
jgi:hypothetical protein